MFFWTHASQTLNSILVDSTIFAQLTHVPNRYAQTILHATSVAISPARIYALRADDGGLKFDN